MTPLQFTLPDRSLSLTRTKQNKNYTIELIIELYKWDIQQYNERLKYAACYDSEGSRFFNKHRFQQTADVLHQY